MEHDPYLSVTSNLQFKQSKLSSDLATITFSLDDSKKVLTRQVYTILDLLRDYGPLQYLLLATADFLLSHFAKYSFRQKLIQQVYMARTTDDQILMDPFNDKVIERRKKWVKISRLSKDKQ